MGDLYNSFQENNLDADKVREHLERIKLAISDNSDLSSVIASAAEEFNTFFKNYGKPYFVAHRFMRHHTPSSALYNETITSADKDISRLYSMVNSSMKLTTKAFNYSMIINEQLLNTATIAASKVIDLSIFAGFLKGKVIVAGDDFYNEDLIDKDAPVSTDQAQPIMGANALGLARSDTVFITNPNMQIGVEPKKPEGTAGGEGNSVNSDPTPGNLERFYEGHFYTYMGELEAEGGNLNIEFIADPSSLPATATTNTVNGVPVDGEDAASAAEEAAQGVGYYAIVSATEEEKQAIRQKMVDGDPSTYWQAEYVYAVPPLIDPYEQLTNGGQSLDDSLVDSQQENSDEG